MGKKNMKNKKEKTFEREQSGAQYQIKLLLWFLWRAIQKSYKFKLGTEIKAAEKFDDLAFFHKLDGRERFLVRFLQAKSSIYDSTLLKYEDFSTSQYKARCNLKKYFNSFRKIKQKSIGGDIQDFIISTPIPLPSLTLTHDDETLEFREISDMDEFFTSSDPSKWQRYKLVEDSAKNNPSLRNIFMHSSNLSLLAEELAYSIYKPKEDNENEDKDNKQEGPNFDEINRDDALQNEKKKEGNIKKIKLDKSKFWLSRYHCALQNDNVICEENFITFNKEFLQMNKSLMETVIDLPNNLRITIQEFYDVFMMELKTFTNMTVNELLTLHLNTSLINIFIVKYAEKVDKIKFKKFLQDLAQLQHNDTPKTDNELCESENIKEFIDYLISQKNCRYNRKEIEHFCISISKKLQHPFFSNALHVVVENVFGNESVEINDVTKDKNAVLKELATSVLNSSLDEKEDEFLDIILRNRALLQNVFTIKKQDIFSSEFFKKNVNDNIRTFRQQLVEDSGKYLFKTLNVSSIKATPEFISLLNSEKNTSDEKSIKECADKIANHLYFKKVLTDDNIFLQNIKLLKAVLTVASDESVKFTEKFLKNEIKNNPVVLMFQEDFLATLALNDLKNKSFDWQIEESKKSDAEKIKIDLVDEFIEKWQRAEDYTKPLKNNTDFASYPMFDMLSEVFEQIPDQKDTFKFQSSLFVKEEKPSECRVIFMYVLKKQIVKKEEKQLKKQFTDDNAKNEFFNEVCKDIKNLHFKIDSSKPKWNENGMEKLVDDILLKKDKMNELISCKSESDDEIHDLFKDVFEKIPEKKDTFKFQSSLFEEDHNISECKKVFLSVLKNQFLKNEEKQSNKKLTDDKAKNKFFTEVCQDLMNWDFKIEISNLKWNESGMEKLIDYIICYNKLISNNSLKGDNKPDDEIHNLFQDVFEEIPSEKKLFQFRASCFEEKLSKTQQLFKNALKEKMLKAEADKIKGKKNEFRNNMFKKFFNNLKHLQFRIESYKPEWNKKGLENFAHAVYEKSLSSFNYDKTKYEKGDDKNIIEQLFEYVFEIQDNNISFKSDVLDNQIYKDKILKKTERYVENKIVSKLKEWKNFEFEGIYEQTNMEAELDCDIKRFVQELMKSSGLNVIKFDTKFHFPSEFYNVVFQSTNKKEGKVRFQKSVFTGGKSEHVELIKNEMKKIFEQEVLEKLKEASIPITELPTCCDIKGMQILAKNIHNGRKPNDNKIIKFTKDEFKNDGSIAFLEYFAESVFTFGGEKNMIKFRQRIFETEDLPKVAKLFKQILMETFNNDSEFAALSQYRFEVPNYPLCFEDDEINLFADELYKMISSDNGIKTIFTYERRKDDTKGIIEALADSVFVCTGKLEYTTTEAGTKLFGTSPYQYIKFSKQFLKDNESDTTSPKYAILLRNLLKEKFKKDFGYLENYEIKVIDYPFSCETMIENGKIEDDITEFCEKLLLSITPNEKDLINIVGEEMATELKLINSNFAVNSIYRTVIDWAKELENRFYEVKEAESCLNGIKSQIASLMIAGCNSLYCVRLNKYNISFENSLNILESFLEDKTIATINGLSEKKILYLNTDEILLTTIKVYQTLINLRWPIMNNFRCQDSFILIPLSDLLWIQEDVLKAFSSICSNDLLVIIEEENTEIPATLFTDLYKILRNHENKQTKKIVFISKKVYLQSKFSEGMKEIYKSDNLLDYNKMIFEYCEDTTTFIDFSKESQEALLNTQIKFQGCNIYLYQLVYSFPRNPNETYTLDGNSIKLNERIDNVYTATFFETMNSKTLTYLINGTEIAIGEAVKPFKNYDEKCYISRNVNLIEINEHLFDKYVELTYHLFAIESTENNSVHDISEFLLQNGVKPTMIVHSRNYTENDFELKTFLNRSHYADDLREFFTRKGVKSEMIHHSQNYTENDHELKGLVQYFEPVNPSFSPFSLEEVLDRTSQTIKFKEKFFINYNHFFILLEHADADNEFKKVCEKDQNYTVHWLKLAYNKLFLFYSHVPLGGRTSFALEFCTTRNTIPNFCVDESELINYILQDKIVLIADSAGMGKSTILTSFERTLQEKDKENLCVTWITRIDLNSYTDILLEIKENSSSPKDILKLDFDVMGETKDFGKVILKSLYWTTTDDTEPRRFENMIFKYFFENSRMLIMFDGFDEISPDFEDIVADLLSKLQSQTNNRIWVTTRPVFQARLQKRCNVLSYDLKRFTKGEQIKFLIKFWKHKWKGYLNPNQEMRMTNYAEKLIINLSDKIGNQYNELIGIPLQTKMLAEIFQKNNYYDDENAEQWHGFFDFITKTISEPYFGTKIKDLYSLYSSLVESKINDYFIKEKEIANLSKPYTPKLKELILFYEIELHRIISFVALKDKYEFTNILTEEEIKKIKKWMKEFKDGTENVGIIDDITKDEKFLFNHLTYAEYFAAGFLKEKLNTSSFVVFDIIEHILNKDVPVFQYCIKYLMFNQNQDENQSSSLITNALKSLNYAAKNGFLNCIKHFTTYEIFEESIESDKNLLHYSVKHDQTKITVFILLYVYNIFRHSSDTESVAHFNLLSFIHHTEKMNILQADFPQHKIKNIRQQNHSYQLVQEVQRFENNCLTPKDSDNIGFITKFKRLNMEQHFDAMLDGNNYAKSVFIGFFKYLSVSAIEIVIQNTDSADLDNSIFGDHSFFYEICGRKNSEEQKNIFNLLLNKFKDDETTILIRYRILNAALKNEELELFKQYFVVKQLNEKALYDLLTTATYVNNLEILKLLLPNCQKLNIPNYDINYTPLFYALTNDASIKIVEYIFQNTKNCDLNPINKQSLLIVALQSRCTLPKIKYLIENGVNISQQFYSHILKTCDQEIIRYFQETRNYQLDYNDLIGSFQRDFARLRKSVIAKNRVEKNLFNFLVRRLNIYHPLYCYYSNNNSSFIENKSTSIGCYIRPTIMEILNKKDENGYTVLHFAAKHNLLDAVIYVLKLGAFYNQTNEKTNETAQTLATENTDIVNLLQRIDYIFSKAKMNDFDEINKFYHYEGIKNPIIRQCKIAHIKDKEGKTLMHYAVLQNNLNACKELKKLGSRINAEDRSGKSAIFYASENDDFEMVKTLLSYGSHYNHQMFEKATTENSCFNFFKDVRICFELMYEEKFEELMVKLETTNFNNMSIGDVSNIRDHRKRSLFEYAQQMNNYDLVLFFLKNGAFVHEMNCTRHKKLQRLFCSIFEIFTAVIKDAYDPHSIITQIEQNDCSSFIHKIKYGKYECMHERKTLLEYAENTNNHVIMRWCKNQE